MIESHWFQPSPHNPEVCNALVASVEENLGHLLGHRDMPRCRRKKAEHAKVCTDLDCPHNNGLGWMDGDWEFFHGD